MTMTKAERWAMTPAERAAQIRAKYEARAEKLAKQLAAASHARASA